MRNLDQCRRVHVDGVEVPFQTLEPGDRFELIEADGSSLGMWTLMEEVELVVE